MPKVNLSDIPVFSGSGYPAPFDEPTRGRHKQSVGDAGGLTQFGAVLITLEPGAWSSQRHAHSHEDELVYVISGELVLIDDNGETHLRAGDFTAHPGGTGNAHHMINKSNAPAQYLVIGTRAPAKDHCSYPDIDLDLPANGTPLRRFSRKDGTIC